MLSEPEHAEHPEQRLAHRPAHSLVEVAHMEAERYPSYGVYLYPVFEHRHHRRRARPPGVVDAGVYERLPEAFEIEQVQGLTTSSEGN